MRVRHKHAYYMAQPITGTAVRRLPNGFIGVRWDNPAVPLDYLNTPHNLIFIVPAGRREITQLDAWKYHALPHPKDAKPLRTHEFLARKPGSMICVCGVGYREPLHRYANTGPLDADIL